MFSRFPINLQLATGLQETRFIFETNRVEQVLSNWDNPSLNSEDSNPERIEYFNK